MDDVVRVKVGMVETRQDRTFLTLVTTEDVEIQFEVDDVTIALLAITAGSTMRFRANNPVPTVFADES